MQYVEKHKEELTKYLMNPDESDLYEWMEQSHQTALTLKKHEKEKLIHNSFHLPTTKNGNP